MTPTARAGSATDEVRKLIFGYRATQLVAAACELKIPDLVAEGPKTADEIAALTHTHPATLRSLMRGLSAWGVFENRADSTFGATALSDCLRADAPGLRAFALMLRERGYQAWGNLMHTLRTGDSAFVDMFGKSTWEMYSEDPTSAARFNAAMAENSSRAAKAFVAAYDLAGIGMVVDVGGGTGALLSAILQAAGQARGMLFDLPQGLAGAQEALSRDGLASRVTLVEGSFFESVPAGGDLYLLKWILHDWSDDESRLILERCRQAMSDTARLAVIERELPDLVDTSSAALDATMADLHMRVVLGGRERTLDEYRELFRAAGLRLTRFIPTASEIGIYEAVRTA